MITDCMNAYIAQPSWLTDWITLAYDNEAVYIRQSSVKMHKYHSAGHNGTVLCIWTECTLMHKSSRLATIAVISKLHSRENTLHAMGWGGQCRVVRTTVHGYNTVLAFWAKTCSNASKHDAGHQTRLCRGLYRLASLLKESEYSTELMVLGNEQECSVAKRYSGNDHSAQHKWSVQSQNSFSAIQRTWPKWADRMHAGAAVKNISVLVQHTDSLGVCHHQWRLSWWPSSCLNRQLLLEATASPERQEAV